MATEVVTRQGKAPRPTAAGQGTAAGHRVPPRQGKAPRQGTAAGHRGRAPRPTAVGQGTASLPVHAHAARQRKGVAQGCGARGISGKHVAHGYGHG